MDTSTRRIIAPSSRPAFAEIEERSLVADLSPDALNRLLRLYAVVISAGVAATAAAATLV